ncbi:hypothetical protein ACH9EU_13350 [Kocuria sp. M1R5S2]|uniref:hypothetical protein n=1 Tax=Kocuria rhizosphaerae TaxID=3376285 RepID=UPI0037AE3495
MTEHVEPGHEPATPHGRRAALRLVGGTAVETPCAESDEARARAAAARAAHPSSGSAAARCLRPVPDLAPEKPSAPGENATGERDARRSDVPVVEGPGPHLVTGPVFVAAARPGDVLRVDVVGLSGTGAPCALIGPGGSAYLPVGTDGATFCPRDLHRALCAAGEPACGSFRVTVVRAGEQGVPSVAQRHPLAETDEHWIVVGRSAADGPEDERTFRMTAAVHRALRAGVDFLERDRGMDQPIAHAYLSATAEFAVSRLGDGSAGAHGRIRKDDFR